MPFLAPLALAGLLFLPVVLAMYLLELRRDEAVVPSTMLWQKLVADVEANAPWQKLRRSLLLLRRRDEEVRQVPRQRHHVPLPVSAGDKSRSPERCALGRCSSCCRAQKLPRSLSWFAS